MVFASAAELDDDRDASHDDNDDLYDPYTDNYNEYDNINDDAYYDECDDTSDGTLG